MAKRRGSCLENMLEQTHQLYRNQGRADINRREIRAIQGRDGKLHYVKREGFDYEGCMRGGRSVAVEAKEAMDRLPINDRGLKQHQLQALLLRGRLGGAAAVIWMVSRNEVYLLDYHFLEYFYNNVYNKPGSRGKPIKSIPLKMAREKGTQVMKNGLVDYLDHLYGQ